MFDVSCPHCDARVLLSARRITGLRNGSDGVVVRYRCWCGHAGALRTGRHASEGVPADSRTLQAAASC